MSTESLPKVSVVVPIYNVEEFLDECLRSLARQSLDSYEVILVDDGSTDSSSAIAQKFAKEYTSFSYFRKPNGGLGHARNFGVEHAHGRYLAFCDSDDVIPPYAYQHLYDLAESLHCDFVSGGVKRMGTSGEYLSSLHVRAFDGIFGEAHITTHPQLVYDTIACNKLFRRSFYDQNHLKWPEGMLYEDIPVTIPAHFLANRFAFLDETVYYWRVRDAGSSSITQGLANRKNLLDRLKAIRMVDEFFERNVKDERLCVEKDKKWLDIDLKLFTNVLPQSSPDFQQLYFDEVIPVLGQITTQAFSQIPTLLRFKYYLAKKHDIHGLENVLAYEQGDITTLTAIYDRCSNAFVGNYPFSSMPDELRDMTHQIVSQSVRSKITNVQIGTNTFILRGRLNVRWIDTTTLDAQTLFSFSLEPISQWPDSDPMSLDASVTRASDGRYDFECELSPDILSDMKPAQYRICIQLNVPNLQCHAHYLSSPIGGIAAHPAVAKRKEYLYSITYSFRRELLLEKRVVDLPLVKSVISRPEGIELIDSNDSSYIIPEHCLHYEVADQLLDPRGTPFLYCQLRNTILAHNNKVLRFAKTATGILGACTLNPGFVMQSFTSAQSYFVLELVKTNPKTLLEGPYKAFLVNELLGAIIEVSCEARSNGIAVVIDIAQSKLARGPEDNVYKLCISPRSNQDIMYDVYSLRDYRRCKASPSLELDNRLFVLRIVNIKVDLKTARVQTPDTASHTASDLELGPKAEEHRGRSIKTAVFENAHDSSTKTNSIHDRITKSGPFRACMKLLDAYKKGNE